MHYWGDEWFQKNGDNLDKAIWFYLKFVRKWGFVKFSNKEKYGSMRTEFVRFWDGGLHYFTCKSFVRICNSFIYFKVDPILKVFTKYTGILWLIRKWQYFIWNLGIQLVCRKYPELTDEMVSHIDYPELIKPIPFIGKVNGTVIHNKYWIKC